jgi:hypothetical protein
MESLRYGCGGRGDAVCKCAEAWNGDGDCVAWGEVDGWLEADADSCGLVVIVMLAT